MIYLWTNTMKRAINWCFLEPKINESEFIKYMNQNFLSRRSDGGKMQKYDINVHNFDLVLVYECAEYKCYEL